MHCKLWFLPPPFGVHLLEFLKLLLKMSASSISIAMNGHVTIGFPFLTTVLSLLQPLCTKRGGRQCTILFCCGLALLRLKDSSCLIGMPWHSLKLKLIKVAFSNFQFSHSESCIFWGGWNTLECDALVRKQSSQSCNKTFKHRKGLWSLWLLEDI